jgi:hypothetical protein
VTIFLAADEANKLNHRYFALLVDSTVTWNLVDKARQNGNAVPRWQWEGYKDGNQVRVISMSLRARVIRDLCSLSSLPLTKMVWFD